MKIQTILRALVLTCLLSSYGYASPTEYHLPLNRSRLINLSIGDSLHITGYPNRSYCCELAAPSTDMSAITFGSANGSQSFLDTATSRGYAPPQINGKDVVSTANARYCWHEGGSTTGENASLTVAGKSQNTDVLCEETTLIGGFNTSVTDFNFLEITVINEPNNIVESTFNGVAVIKTSISNQTIKVPFSVSLAPGESLKRVDISIHDAISGAKDFGQISIIHSGSKDQVKALLTQYRIVTQSPLDFEPVLQEVFKPVSGN